MTTKNIDTITVTLKNGQCFNHNPPKPSFEEQLGFMNEILSEWTKAKKGILMLRRPVALYNMEDVSSIHFPGMVQGLHTTRMPVGFHPYK